MANPIKYSEDFEPFAIRRGNFWIGAGDISKGETQQTGFWNGITPPPGGFVIYINKNTQGPSIYVCPDQSELISITNRISGTNFTNVVDCLSFYVTQTDRIVMNSDLSLIDSDSLSLYFDPNLSISYPFGGTGLFDIGPSGNNGEILGSYTYDDNYIYLNNSDSYIKLKNEISIGSGDWTIQMSVLSNRITGDYGYLSLASSSSNDSSIQFTENDTIYFQNSLGATFASYRNIDNTLPLDGSQFLVTFVGSSGSVKMFYDNIETNVNSPVSGSLALDIVMGVTFSSSSGGAFKKIIFYDKALSNEQIFSNYFSFIMEDWVKCVNSSYGSIESSDYLQNTVEIYDSVEPSIIKWTDNFKNSVSYLGGSVLGDQQILNSLRLIYNPNVDPSFVFLPYATGQRKIYEYVSLKDGVIKENLLQRSQDFINSYWGKTTPLTQVQISSEIASDGISLATKISESNNSQEFKIFRNSVSTTTGSIYTISIEARPGERSYFYIQLSNGTGSRFDMVNGTVVGNRPTSPLSSGVIKGPNGWNRYWISISAASTSIIPEFGLLSGNNDTSSYTGVSGSGAYFWGAQINEFTIPLKYTATTISPILPYSNFARGSTGTYFNRFGNIQYSPNEIPWSNDFNTSSWVRTNGSVLTKNQRGPNNQENSAYLLTLPSSTAQHSLSTTSDIRTVFGTIYSEFWVVKKMSTPFVQICTAGTGTAPNLPFSNFNLDLGIVTSSSYAIPYIKKLNYGYWLIGLTYTATIDSTNHNFWISPIRVPDQGRNATFAGNGLNLIVYSSGRLVGSFESNLPYIINSTSNDSPRLNWNNTDDTGGIIFEPQKTNLIVQSENLDLWGLAGTASVANNQIASPSGVINGDLITVNQSNSYVRLSSIPTLNNNSYSLSFYVKNGDLDSGESMRVVHTNNKVSPGNAEMRCAVNPTTGSVTRVLLGTVGTGVTGSVTGSNRSIGNGWFYVTNTYRLGSDAASSNSSVEFYALSGGNMRSYYVWGVQLELNGSTAYPSVTSYIPTLGSTATRVADTATWSNAITLSENGTLFIDSEAYQRGTAIRLISGNSNNRISLFIVDEFGRCEYSVMSSGVTVSSSDPTPLNNQISKRHCIVWSPTQVKVFINGQSFVTLARNNSFDDNTFYLSFGSLTENSYWLLRSMALYPVSLTDQQCINLTRLT